MNLKNSSVVPRTLLGAVLGTFIGLACGSQAVAADAATGKMKDKGQQIEHGRYVIVLGGCNDCHTAGYGEANGKTPESQWLMGSPLGFKGPWGTTYAANLRTYFARFTADEFVKESKKIETRPPMPWFTLHQISDTDLRAMYAFVKSLGPGGVAAPAYLPPGKDPTGPVATWPMPPAK